MKYEKPLLHSIILLLIFAIIFIIRNEIFIAIILLVFLIITFKIKYFKGEWALFILGVILGSIIELGGGPYKLQYWEQGSLLGIPIWLPIIWGIGFIYIRRIGNLIVKK